MVIFRVFSCCHTGAPPLTRSCGTKPHKTFTFPAFTFATWFLFCFHDNRSCWDELGWAAVHQWANTDSTSSGSASPNLSRLAPHLLTHRLIDWFNYWLIDWLVGWLIDWSTVKTSWFMVQQNFSSVSSRGLRSMNFCWEDVTSAEHFHWAQPVNNPL